MKSTIVYIHGYGSSPQSETAVKIAERFRDEEFICPQINHDLDPQVTKKQLDQLAAELKRKDDVIIVGSSMGGFWADYLSVAYGFKTILINPALQAQITMQRFNTPQNFIDKYDMIRQNISPYKRHAVVFYGVEDDIVPIGHIINLYPYLIPLAGEGHRLKNVEPIFEMIQKMMGNYPEPE